VELKRRRESDFSQERCPFHVLAFTGEGHYKCYLERGLFSDEAINRAFFPGRPESANANNVYFREVCEELVESFTSTKDVPGKVSSPTDGSSTLLGLHYAMQEGAKAGLPRMVGLLPAVGDDMLVTLSSFTGSREGHVGKAEQLPADPIPDPHGKQAEY
jgi:hypothetical protein